MNIGIIVYSQTGNTLSIAKKLEEKLSAAGHSATLEEVKVVGERKQGDREFRLETLPGHTMRSCSALQWRLFPYRRY